MSIPSNVRRPIRLDVGQLLDTGELVVVEFEIHHTDSPSVTARHPLAAQVVAEQVPSDPVEPRARRRSRVPEPPPLHEGGSECLRAEIGGCLGRVSSPVQELEDWFGVAVVEQSERVRVIDCCVEQRRIRELGEVVHPSRYYRSCLILLHDIAPSEAATGG